MIEHITIGNMAVKDFLGNDEKRALIAIQWSENT